MRKCEDCKVILDPDVRFCPKCGKNVAANGDADPGASIHVGALLTAANLHRIREEWDEAVADATEALKLDPRNADIASLLGSIYEQRGMLEEAVIWYHLALELSPDSISDKVRLERVKEQIAAKGTDPLRALQKRTRIWVAALSGVLVLVLIVSLLAIRARNGGEPVKQPVRAIRPAPPATREAPRSPTGPTPPEGMARTGEQRPSSEAASGAGAPFRLPSEVYIRSEVGGTPAVKSAGAQIDDVIVDPREGIATVTFSLQSRMGLTKPEVLNGALAVARAAFDVNRNLKFVTARCVVSPGGTSAAQVAFIGDVARVSVDSLTPNPTGEQVEQVFTRPFWNPQIR